MGQKYFILPLLVLLMGCGTTFGPVSHSSLNRQIYYQNLQTTSFFNSPQKISIVEVSKESLGNKTWHIGFSRDSLIKTSEFALRNQALVAINGGFFNMREGGSVTYLEVEGQVINLTVNEAERWANDWPVVKGALVITEDDQIKIEPNRSATYYQRSAKEKAVLVTGPLLLEKGKRSPLGETDFINKRHPRSCVCETADKRILLIAVDGRNTDAAGMSLPELQEFLLLKSCNNAINLDGGGSTTLWVKEQGIVNAPSDKTGERPVANVLYLKEK